MKTQVKNTTTNEFLNNFEENLIRDFDLTLKNYFSKNLKLTVTDKNSNRKMVPIQFGTFERWYQNKVENDEQINRQTDYPRLFIKQSDIELPEEKYIFKNEQTQRLTRTQYSGKTANGEPIWEVADIDIPTYIAIGYDISFYCFYMNQVNEIIQQIISRDNKIYVTTAKGFNLKLTKSGFSDNSNIDDFSDEQRLFGKTFTVTLSGNFFIGKDFNRTNISREYTSPKISIREKSISGDDMYRIQNGLEIETQ